jgi:hypothetical protein
MAAMACRPAASATDDARACRSDDVVVRGACVRGAQADRYCGDAARWSAEAGACVPRTCDEGQLLDEATGECLGARALRAIGERQHVLVGPEQHLGCRDGTRLRIAAGNARCVASTSPPPAGRACGPGELRAASGCVRVAREGGRTDVAAWATAVLGSGTASPVELCARATLDPAPYGLLNGQSLTVELDVALVYPDNDVRAVYAHVTPTRQIPAAALARIVAVVDAEVELLRALGGTAEVASDARHVVCAVQAGTSPLPVQGQSARGGDEKP